MKIISIDKQSAEPLYQQIVKSIENAILQKKIFRNDRLPSVNKLCIEYKISRDTVLRAYEELKKRGVVKSVLAKGYYVRTENIMYNKNYFVLFDELNSFKEDLLNGLSKSLPNVHIDVFFHHFNLNTFRKFIFDNMGDYSKYIIMPGNLEGVEEVIAKLPEEDVYIIDQMRPTLNKYSAVYQNFVEDIYKSLKSSKSILQKYNHYIIIFPGEKEPIGMVKGFKKYCEADDVRHSVISNLENHTIEKGQLFLIPDDRQLVEILESCEKNNVMIGEDVGIISYNETPLKKVVSGGITTISTDFFKMGQRLAEMLNNSERGHIENSSKLVVRKSI